MNLGFQCANWTIDARYALDHKMFTKWAFGCNFHMVNCLCVQRFICAISTSVEQKKKTAEQRRTFYEINREKKMCVYDPSMFFLRQPHPIDLNRLDGYGAWPIAWMKLANYYLFAWFVQFMSIWLFFKTNADKLRYTHHFQRGKRKTKLRPKQPNKLFPFLS